MISNFNELINYLNANIKLKEKIEPFDNELKAPNEVVAEYMLDTKPKYFWFSTRIYPRIYTKGKPSIFYNYGLLNGQFDKLNTFNTGFMLTPRIWNNFRRIKFENYEEIELVNPFDYSEKKKSYLFNIGKLNIPNLFIDTEVLFLLYRVRSIEEIWLTLYRYLWYRNDRNDYEFGDFIFSGDKFDHYRHINEIISGLELGYKWFTYSFIEKIEKSSHRRTFDMLDIFTWFNNVFDCNMFIIPINIRD